MRYNYQKIRAAVAAHDKTGWAVCFTLFEQLGTPLNRKGSRVPATVFEELSERLAADGHYYAPSTLRKMRSIGAKFTPSQTAGVGWNAAYLAKTPENLASLKKQAKAEGEKLTDVYINKNIATVLRDTGQASKGSRHSAAYTGLSARVSLIASSARMYNQEIEGAELDDFERAELVRRIQEALALLRVAEAATTTKKRARKAA